MGTNPTARTGKGPHGSRTPEAMSERLYQFALRTVRLVDALPRQRIPSWSLGNQLVRAATSASSNYEKARGAVSKADFVAKIGICYKETREAVFWLRLIADAKLLMRDRMEAILAEAMELRAILGSSLKTSRSRKDIP